MFGPPLLIEEYEEIPPVNAQSAQIAAAVKQMLGPQQDAVHSAQAASDASSQQQQTNITGLSSALANILGGIGPGVEKTYADASTRQAAFAKGFSDHMQAQLGQNAAGTSSFLQSVVGAPQSQVSQVAAQTAPAAAGDTLYGVRGYIPASTLNEEGAAYTANARQLPGVANSQGLQQIGRVQAAQRATDQGFADQLAKIAAQAPGLTRQLANDAFSQKSKTASLTLQQQKLAAQLQNQGFGQKATAYRLKQADQRLSLDAKKFAVQQTQSNRSYGIALAGLGLRQAAAQRAATAAEYKLANGGFTPSQLAHYDGLLQGSINTIKTAKDPATGATTYKATYYDKAQKMFVTVPATYSEFVANAFAEGIPLSLVIERANTFYPPEARPAPGILADVLGISKAAAAASTGFDSQLKGYNQTTGAIAPAKQKLMSYAFKSGAQKYGWGSPAEQQALATLWDGESGWNPAAKNPSSGALGIPQALGHTLPPDYAKNPQSQINWGLNYIKQRYGSPSAALAFWQSNNPHWY